MLIAAIVAAFLLHKLGHYWAALWFGHKLRFRFAWGRFGVPRLVWRMPHFYQCEIWKARVIAGAGFGTELFAAVVLLAAWHEFGLWYTGVAVAHLAAGSMVCGGGQRF